MEQTCFHQCLYSVVQLQDIHFFLKIEYYRIISINTGKFLMGLNLKSCQHFRHKVKIWAAIEYCTQCTPSSFLLIKTCRSCLFHNNILIFYCLSYHILQRHNMQIPVVTSQTLQGTFVVGICAAPSCGSAWCPNRLHCCFVVTVVYFVEPCLTKYRAVATRPWLPIFSWQAHACEKSFSFLNLHGIQSVWSFCREFQAFVSQRKEGVVFWLFVQHADRFWKYRGTTPQPAYTTSLNYNVIM